MSKHRTSNGFSPSGKFVFPREIYFARLLFVASCCRFLKTSRNVFIFTHMLGLLTNNNRRWFKSSSVCFWFILHFSSHWAAKIFITVGTSDASDHFTSLVETETFSWMFDDDSGRSRQREDGENVNMMNAQRQSWSTHANKLSWFTSRVVSAYFVSATVASSFTFSDLLMNRLLKPEEI